MAAWLYNNGKVVDAESDSDVVVYTVHISADNLSRLNKMATGSNLIVIRK